jgi:sec-independent protein translocase protein TatA
VQTFFSCGKEIFKMAGLGVPELLIILAVVLLVFGVGRISRIGSELGKGISAFREGVRDGKEETEDSSETDSVNDTEA